MAWLKAREFCHTDKYQLQRSGKEQFIFKHTKYGLNLRIIVREYSVYGI